MLYEILSDLVKIENVLFVIKSNGAVSEIRSNMLNIRQKEKSVSYTHLTLPTKA